MLDARHAELATVTLAAFIAFVLMMDACRYARKRGALELWQGRLLHKAQFPGPYRLGLGLMQGVGLVFAFGAVRGATALFDIIL